MTKRCKVCEEVKDFTEFTVAYSNKDGHAGTCKKCVCLRNRQYWRTPIGRMSNIYVTQVTSSKARNHPKPAYSREELKDWAFAHGLEELCLTWGSSDYSKNLAPSVDRLDPNKPYSLDNIRLVTWQENNEKAYEDRKSCVHVTRQNRKILQLTLTGVPIKAFASISSAARETGVCRTAINYVCQGSYTTPYVGGYLWQYA